MDILVTRRLTLRPPLEVDAEAIAAALQNKDVTRNLTRVPYPYSHQDAVKWIAGQQDMNASACFGIYRQKLLGVVSVEPDENNNADLGYWLSKEAWGQGFMSEAARATVSHVFRKYRYEQITSGAYEDNRASMAVLEKLGFETSGKESHFNPTRGSDVICNRVVLRRERFEQIFGSLETEAAA